MVKQPEVLAVIPARGGSKGIPRKNIRRFAGFPLIAYSIAAARQAGCVTRTIVSTDDEEIAAAAREWDAETPFLRPAELARDETTDFPVFQHALEWLANNEAYHPDVVIQLRPTSPVRPRGLVDEAVRILLDHPEADSVRGVIPAGQNPHKMWRIDSQGVMHNLLSVEGLREPYNAPRQALPPVYWQTGHIDAIRASTILNKNSMSGDVILPLLIDPHFTVDIDNLNDWQRAEWLVREGRLDMVRPGRTPRSFPRHVELLVMDFDGVITDNRVWVDGAGREMVAANRSDSLGLVMLRQHTPIRQLVISKERDLAVAARCNKIGVPFMQGIDDKALALQQYIEETGIEPGAVIYVGNDVNDLPSFATAGFAVAVSDSHPEVIQAADLVLAHRGGHGAVREICDILLEHYANRSQ